MGLFGNKAAKRAEEEKKNNLKNLSKGSQIKFGIPYFDVVDPRAMDHPVPVSVHGSLVYSIHDLDLFCEINKDEDFTDETFQAKLKSQVMKFVKSVITNAPSDGQFPLIQIERKIVELSEMVQERVAPQVERLFGITVRSLDIASINVDKDSRGYRELKSITADLDRDNRLTIHNANLSNFKLNNDLQQESLRMQSQLNLDAQRRQQEMSLGGQEALQSMQLENQRETLRIKREEMQRASRLQTEQTFLGAHQVDMKAWAAANSANGAQSQPVAAAEEEDAEQLSVPQVQYMVGIKDKPEGPFDWGQLQQLVQLGHLTPQSQVWKQGMPAWALAGELLELQPLFSSLSPTMGGMPPMK